MSLCPASAFCQANNFLVVSCTTIATIFLFQIPKEILFLLFWEAWQGMSSFVCTLLIYLHCTTFVCTVPQTIAPTLAHSGADCPAFWQLFVNWDTGQSKWEVISWHCILSTAAHTEQIIMRDIIKINLLKHSILLFFLE